MGSTREGLGSLPRAPAALVPRLRLDHEIGAEPLPPLTALVAPVGFGKTQALAGWARRAPRAVQWLSVAAHDGAASDDAVLAPILEALSTTSTASAAIAIDDAQRLSPGAWRRLADRLDPRSITPVLLASRSDVPLPLHGRGRVIGPEELRFTEDEAESLVRAVVPDLSLRDALMVRTQAQGWAAALVLGARAMAGSGSRPDGAAVPGEVVEYLLADLYSALPASTRHVLLCTAQLDRVVADDAIVLSGDVHAPDRLDALAQGPLVDVVRHREAGTTTRAWRYHPLLRSLLARRLRLDGPDQALVRVAHRRAAEHEAGHGALLTAVQHAARAGAMDVLVPLLSDEGPRLVASGDEGELLDALASIPDKVVRRTPALMAVAALAHLAAGRAETAASIARQAAGVSRDGRAEAAEPGLRADNGVLRLWRARLGWADVAAAVADARAILRAADHPGSGPQVSPVRRVLLLDELASAELLTEAWEDAEEHLREALAGARELGYPKLVSAVLADTAMLEMLHGRMRSASDAAAESIASALDVDRGRDPHLCRAHLVAGYTAFYALDDDAAAAALRRIQENTGRALDPLVAALSTVLSARLTAGSGDLDAARRALSGLGPVPDVVPGFIGNVYAVVRGHLAITAGDLTTARLVTAEMERRGFRELHVLFTARLALEAWVVDPAGGSVPEGLDELVSARTASPLGAASAAVLSLSWLLRSGSPESARPRLREALDLIADQRLLRALMFTGPVDPAIVRMLEDEAADADGHPYAGAALAALRRHGRGAKADVPAGLSTAPPLTLTDREKDVLRELALGGSYVDVARALFVTENTVKTHVTSLYRKLGVTRRADALRKARAAGLLDDSP